MAEVLVVGNGAREHALGWKLSQSPEVSKVYFAQGNAGTASVGENVAIHPQDIRGLRDFAIDREISLTVPGPDQTVAYGIADAFARFDLPVFAPTQSIAKLESSKIHSDRKMSGWGIPQPNAWPFTQDQIYEAYYFLMNHDPGTYVIKADGFAAGKGVFLPETLEEVRKIHSRLMFEEKLGPAGVNILIQERLVGREASIHALSDGQILPVLRDYKQLNGNMTGGMGGYGPVPDISADLIKEIKNTITDPIFENLRAEGTPYKGVLYPGLMITEDGPKVLELNCRFGDPEAELLMMLIKSDLYQTLLGIATNNPIDMPLEYFSGSVVGTVLASRGYGEPRGHFLYVPIKGIEGVTENDDLKVFHGGTKVEEGQLKTDGGRVLTIAARGSTLEVAREAVYGVVGEEGINFWEMQYRPDIAL